MHRVLDARARRRHDRTQIERHEVADCTLVASKPLAFDTADVLGPTSRFVLVDRFRRGGVIRRWPIRRRALLRCAVKARAHSRTPMTAAPSAKPKPGLLVITGARRGPQIARALKSD